MNLRIQTYGKQMASSNPSSHATQMLGTEGTTVYDALEKGLDDLMDLCDVVTATFTDTRDDFAASMDAQ